LPNFRDMFEGPLGKAPSWVLPDTVPARPKLKV